MATTTAATDGARSLRAAVCHEFGGPLRVETVHLDPPGADEVSVDVRACAICASDLHAAAGSWGGDLPAIHGHEASGVVRRIGPGVPAVAPGDRVVVSLLRSCRACFFCDIGSPHLCAGRDDFDLAHTTRLRTIDGAPIAQGVYTGAFAEAVVVHASQVAPVPDGVPFEAAALLACGVATGYGAATKSAPVPAGSTVAVIGAGGVGLNTVQGAVARGARRILAVDVSEAKLADALEFGATDVATVDDAPGRLAALTDGRGADLVFVTVGSTAAIEQGLGWCRRGGTTVVVGMTAGGEHVRIETSGFASDGKHLVGSFLGSTDLQNDVADLAGRYLGGELLLDELVTHRYPLERINEAIASTATGEVRRNVIVFDA